ncbi:unnamed protein product [Angiostrongylus costaricensis]|uniref:Secreted protein n=1 Tax=Angiostrongylus costaricensis TaxID=334426 RepID=A0A0R3PVU5_ANGCS|nr:unnamed protein product [Angiostrongylus costaricensis]
MTLAQILFALLLICYAYASKVFYQAKVGDRVVLDLGRDVVTWKRVRNNGEEEHIKYCKAGETDPCCKDFVTKDGKPATPPTKAHVDEEGKLIFDPFVATDVGLYSSPDQKPKEVSHDGVVSAVLNTHISLVVEE